METAQPKRRRIEPDRLSVARHLGRYMWVGGLVTAIYLTWNTLGFTQGDVPGMLVAVIFWLIAIFGLLLNLGASIIRRLDGFEPK